jgi:hypothetical protein
MLPDFSCVAETLSLLAHDELKVEGRHEALHYFVLQSKHI